MKIKYLFLFLCVVILLVVPIFLLPRLVNIKEIICKSQFGSCPIEISTLLDSAKDKSLYYSKKEINSHLKESLIVERYSTAFKLPNIIEVFVIIKKPFYAVKTKDGLTFLILKDGLVISKVASTNLPTLEINSNLEINNRLDEKHLFALRVISDIFSLYKIHLSKIERESLLVEIENGPKVIFPLEGDNKVLVGAFRMLFEQLNSGSEKFRIEKALNQITIDLRYKNPIIK
ncbi:MAG TPA: hypothetical protein VJ399_01700 [Patescibacteria group bacterium]|nr:hypothetical protein [Patescibacteria group bacterium]